MSTQLSDDIHFIGCFDDKIRSFDIIMHTANGSSYNAYLVKGSEGVAIVDTVKKEFSQDFFKQVESLTDYNSIKYIILNHLEPDHSGALSELLEKAPHAEVLVSSTGVIIFNSLLKDKLEKVKYRFVSTGDSISLGNRNLHFYSTPYLHWPDTMCTYDDLSKTLFSGDVFGCHFCDRRLFNDKVGEFHYSFKYYYDHIMRPFKSYVISALKLLEPLEINIIAPVHGPILRSDPQFYMDLYKKWSHEDYLAKEKYGDKRVNIFYASSYGATKIISEAIFEGIESIEGARAGLYDLEALEKENMIRLLEESDGIAVGSPTINGDAVEPAWILLAQLAYIDTRGKMGIAFGSYGWSGEACRMLEDRLKGLKLRVPMEALRLKMFPNDEELKKAFDYGKEFAEILKGKMIEMTI